MADSARPHGVLYVEGRDDQFSVADLLRLHDFQMDQSPRDVEIKLAGGRDPLLELIATAVKASTDTWVGFVVDADASAEDTWRAIAHRIGRASSQARMPPSCPPDGLVVDVADLRTRVGVWIMPDNTMPGSIETFLEQLVAANDPLIECARSSV